MSVAFYMDVHVPAAITRALRRRSVDVITAQEDGTARSPDVELLDRASSLERMISTRDSDFLAEAVRCQRAAEPFATVIYAHQRDASIGQCVKDLELIAQTASFDEKQGQIVYLPL